jgi:uncharacterized protein
MTNGLTVELLESTHNFPCRYVFKAIGGGDDEFAGRVAAAVRVALDASADPPYQLRHTSSGRHVSVTLEPVVRSAQDVLTVYQRLNETEGVVMIL